MKNLISFITCVNDESLYSKCLRHIKSLNIPNGYNYEIIPIYDAKSLTSGYNRAMNKSNAKYKIYLHQDTFIVNKNFVQDILNIFINPKIGMIGVAGASTIPMTGCWWNSKKRYGKVIESSHLETKELALLAFIKFDNDYKIVKCIDGLIMATQYDISWREDIFDGWDLYDESQCLEFYKAGYKVCVPNQKAPWCIHDCGRINFENYDKYRKLFLDEYANSLFTFGRFQLKLYRLNKMLRPYQKKVETFVKRLIK